MDILHGTWIPDPTPDFIQTGNFYLWVETDTPTRRKTPGLHPGHLSSARLVQFLTESLGIKPYSTYSRQTPKKLETDIRRCHFLLPTAQDAPLPSWEMARYLELELPDRYEWQFWSIDCYNTVFYRTYSGKVNNVVKLLHDLHFLTQHRLSEVQMGADLLFWYGYTQGLKQVLLRDQYIPALKYRSQPSSPASNPRKPRSSAKGTLPQTTSPNSVEIYPAWEIISEQYETLIQDAIARMPLFCCAGFAEPPDSPSLYDRETLLRHFSECWLSAVVTQTPYTSTFENKLQGTLLAACIHPHTPWRNTGAIGLYQQWQDWRDRINQSQAPETFNLCFQLWEPPDPDEPWELVFQVSPKQDPSSRIDLELYWRAHPDSRHQFGLGDNFEQGLLLHLGYAARIYPKLWDGLETDRPSDITLTLAEAFEFLQEAAWILEDAGYQVLVPAWWTPKGRQRAKVRLRATSSPKANGESTGYFSATSLASYDYELAIGDQTVSESEWKHLVETKTPMVQFRGQWMVLDQDQMKQMLEFWKKQREQQPELSLFDLMRLAANEKEDVELAIDHDQTLSEMLHRLQNPAQLEEIADPNTFQGQLRPYQRRGVSWMVYLESLGLNGCLADDMGMGKSAQVIAHLVLERERHIPKPARSRRKPSAVATIPPTLLIAPTSVVGNWGKEVEKFAPHLRIMLHHGNQRIKDNQDFQQAIADCDLVVTSYALARLDSALLNQHTWHRVIIDEAQNIKNPKAAQTKAILKLPANHRLALTGTPVENRLLDLWSIFNFLNPGYLGKESQFRQSFEIPIQKDNNLTKSQTLKKLVEPFILRRVKTDPAIIQDLPDKVEQKCYCNLTKEQAALYQAVVKEVTKSIDQVQGIQRKGMILATLTKLKQICNHPMQFLQDNSEFTPTRSHKLERLLEMIEEVMAEEESLLLFTQFTEIGEALEKLLKHRHYNTYYLHGGTPRDKRERMIQEFQAPETEPSIFILSLKAGGVGITLTKANHVFHFDRWWNPAVEDQATDRAFRIGQTKNVFVHKFIALGTLEEKIDQMIEDKKKLAGAIVGSDEAWLSELDNQAFKQLISLNRKAVVD